MSDDFKTLTNPTKDIDKSANYVNTPLESKIDSLIIKKVDKEGKKIKFDILPWDIKVSTNSPYKGMVFKESIYDVCMFGSLFVYDLRNWIDEFQFTGTESIELKIKIGTSIQPITFNFDIYDAKLISDDSFYTEKSVADERISIWKLDFVSSQIFIPNYNQTILETNEDYVGTLSSSYDGSIETTFNDESAFFEEENSEKKKSLINAIFEKYKLPVNKIDSSRTGIWLKSDHVAYPWMKRKGQLKVLTLLKYLSNYAWDGNTSKYHCDYYCWQDRDGWNFRSISKMLSSDGEGKKLKDPVEGFIITADETNPNKIVKIDVKREYSIFNLLNSYALTSAYLRTDPNFDNVYLDFTDSTEAYKQTVLAYDYQKSYDDIIQIGKYKLVPDNFDTSPIAENGKLKQSIRIDDEIYGYFNENFLNTPTPVEWEHYGKTASIPWSNKAWQPQFDLSDLYFENFKVIHQDIRVPLKKKREEYARKKNIKRKWETYRCTVCCHENGALGSTKDIEIFNNPGAVDGYTYNALFGPTGMFSDYTEEYKIVAAGSFTDLINYEAGNTFYEKGLTYSYDLTKQPYNQTIGQFFNLTGPDVPSAYYNFVLNRSIRLYNIIINKMNERILDLDDFVNNRVTSYIQEADQLFTTVLLNKESESRRPIDLTKGFRFIGNAVPGETTLEWPITESEFGKIPSSSIPIGKGVAQVIFPGVPESNTSGGGQDDNDEDRSTPDRRSFTFRNSSSDGGIAGGCDPSQAEAAICFYCQLQSDNNLPTGQCQQINSLPISVDEPDGARICPNVGDPNYPVNLPPGPQGTYWELYRVFTEYDVCSGNSLPSCDTVCPVFEVTRHCCSQTQSNTCTTYQASNLDDLPPCPSGFTEVPSCSVCTGGDGDGGQSGGTGACITSIYQNGVPVSTTCRITTRIDCDGIFLGEGTECPDDDDDVFIIVFPGLTGAIEQPEVREIPFDSYRSCSSDPIIRGYIKYRNEEIPKIRNSVQNNFLYSPIYLYAAPYLWDDSPNSLTNIKDWSFFDYGSESGLIPGVSDGNTRAKTRNCLLSGGCYNTTCLSSVALEVLKRTCIAEKELLQKEKELFVQLRDKVQNEFLQKWSLSYATWYQRNSFFFSKNPGTSIFKNVDKPTVEAPISLQNIKSVTRKEIRGSRYELLSRYVGITGGSAGPWLYNIYFGGNSGSTAHPYYDQKYNETGYITSREAHRWYTTRNVDRTDSPVFSLGDSTNNRFSEQYGPEYRGNEFVEYGVVHIGKDDRSDFTKSTALSSMGYAQSDLTGLISNSFDGGDSYKNTFNFYNLTDKKPPNVKMEEISSYVRVEFKNPIGLDRINEFPNGFVRDAGTEYFLPYLVNLTVGPVGKQSVKYNAAVIGMDPYGFDVAVKKIKDDIPLNRKLQGIDKGNYYRWWNHDTGSVLSKTEYLSSDYNGMDLWPEDGFETEFPYYAYDASQEDIHGGGYDLDFHMGGGYYFENQSQDWMESLYHYGMSSGKQFDPLYRTSVVGSYILPNSYRKLKPHRSWWSFFVPRNLFVPIRFANMFKTPNTKARDLFGGGAAFTISPNYWRSWYGSEFQTWLSLSENGKQFLSDSPLNFSVDVPITQTDTADTAISPIKNALGTYFNDSLMNYLAGNYILYRPNLVQTELWKYDLSGDSDYGLITPPVDTEYEFFDRNFSIQFSVLSRNRSVNCDRLGLKCANPEAIKDGLVLSADGCIAAPYCNCPAQYNIPTEPEPTYLELYKLKNELNECALITENMGDSWLGCDYSNPEGPMSCNCPEQGENFKYYLEYDRTYSTFWETPLDLPLKRKAQTEQLQAQMVELTIPPNENIKIGEIVEIINPNDVPGETINKFKKISGKWMVSEISHVMPNSIAYLMTLTLVRNALQYDPNESQEPKGPFIEKNE